MYHPNKYLWNRPETDIGQLKSRKKGIILIMMVLGLLMVVTSTGHAQIDSLKAGDRIRVSVPSYSKNRIIGTVEGISPIAIKLATQRSDKIIPRTSIERLWVSQGRKSNFAKFIVIGATVGGLIMGVSSLASNSSPSPCEPNEYLCIRIEFSDGEAFVIGAIFGTLTGAVTGGVIGLLTKSDHWERKPLHVSMVLTPGIHDYRQLSPVVTLRLFLN